MLAPGAGNRTDKAAGLVQAGATRRPLGLTGLCVPQLGAGCGSLATGGTETETVAMLQTCWDRGLRHFDTAPLYGGSEERLGRFLDGRDRGAFSVSTKVGRFPAHDGARRFSFRRADVGQSVVESLRRLRLGHIDMLSLHDLTPAMLGGGYDEARRDLRDGTLDLLMALRRDGTVGSLGVAVYDPEAALSLMPEAPFDYVLIVGAYTLLSQSAGRALLPYCAQRGIGVLAASPFHTGLLVTGAVPGARFNFGEPSQDMLRRVTDIQRLCGRHGVALPAAALQFGLRHPVVASIITGHRSPAEVDANLAWLDAPIPEAFWQDLADERMIEPGAAGPAGLPGGFAACASRGPGSLPPIHPVGRTAPAGHIVNRVAPPDAG